MKIGLLAIVTALSIVQLPAQPFAKAVNDAYMITRMAEKFHYRPRLVDNSFSADIYTQFLKVLDAQKIFFTVSDINALQRYKYLLDDEIKNKSPEFLQTITTLYQTRLRQVQSMIAEICKRPFNFYYPDKITINEDTTYPRTTGEQTIKIYKLLKSGLLSAIINNNSDIGSLSQKKQISFLKNIEPGLRFKVQASFNRSITRMTQGPGGLQRKIVDEYCKVIALCYDPHTEYLPAKAKEDLDTELGNKSIGFGFSLKTDSKGNVFISDLLPGSPAYKSGQINLGDKITFIQMEGSVSVDLSGATIKEINEVLDNTSHGTMVFTLKKPDGTKSQVALSKEKIENDADENKVKSFLLKGDKTIGFISLPSFYEDWENDKGINGCANDVAKEIVKLKKENIDGLIIDLRFNSGGSMQEAIEMAGIFIDAGPVAQYKRRGEEIITLKDANKGTIYDGPLFLMVNGYSASASEMFAATLQDYNRAVIIGSPTYGKSTTQIVMPLDSALTPDSDLTTSIADTYLKITIAQLYRVTGKTFQGVGVTPDVLLPDINSKKENSNLFVLESAPVPSNKFYIPAGRLSFNKLNAFAKNEIASSAYFTELLQYEKANSETAKQDISLRLADALASQKIATPKIDTALENKIFKVENNAYDNERLDLNKTLKNIDNEWRKHLTRDPYVKLTYLLIARVIK